MKIKSIVVNLKTSFCFFYEEENMTRIRKMKRKIWVIKSHTNNLIFYNGVVRILRSVVCNNKI